MPKTGLERREGDWWGGAPSPRIGWLFSFDVFRLMEQNNHEISRFFSLDLVFF